MKNTGTSEWEQYRVSHPWCPEEDSIPWVSDSEEALQSRLNEPRRLRDKEDPSPLHGYVC